MTYPHNADEWWMLCDTHLDAFCSYIEASPVNTPMLQALRDSNQSKAADAIAPWLGQSVSTAIRALVKARNVNVAHVFQSIWDDAPDSPSIHSWPSWAIFCDLLSESHVLGDEGCVI